jgi:DNA-binding transcriptional LysR family regulator
VGIGESVPPEPELRHLRTFVAVAEELHFTRAAEKLHMAQQALSAQIRNLEASLEVKLFDRTTRRVELTDAGRTLLAHAMPLLASASRAWDEVARAGAGEVGQVSVSYAPTARREILPRLLREFHDRYPRLEVRTCEVWWGTEAIIEGIADVAITRAPAPEDSDIVTVAIAESALGVVLGSSHPLAQHDGVAVEQLGSEAIELPARRFSPDFHDLILATFRSRGFSGPVYEFENLGSSFLLGDPSACAEIASRRAFGFGFENQYPALPPDLVWRPIAPTLSVPMNMCWRRSAGATVQNFVAVALDVARAEGWRHDYAAQRTSTPRTGALSTATSA